MVRRLNKITPTTPRWRAYERVAAALEAQEIGMDVTISPNVYVMGRHSQTPRQIDALIEARWPGGISRRIVVDAKQRRRKLDVNDVGSFLSLLDDCGAERGVLYSPAGWTPGAERLARDLIRVKLLDDELMEQADWARLQRCESEEDTDVTPCAGVLLWDGNLLDSFDGALWAIYYTGVCDVCHRFHVWCWDCGERFIIPTNGDYVCMCQRHWACAMQDEPVSEAADRYAYLLVAPNGEEFRRIDRIVLTRRGTRSVGQARHSDRAANQHRKN